MGNITYLSGALICKIICSYMIIAFRGLLFASLLWNIYPLTFMLGLFNILGMVYAISLNCLMALWFY